MSILEEIRKQPTWLREVFFGLSVVTTVSIVGMVWFHSFQRNMFALLNPPEEFDQRFYAQENKQWTPVAFVGEGVSKLRAGVYSLLNIDSSRGEVNIDAKDQRVYPLPLSGDRN